MKDVAISTCEFVWNLMQFFHEMLSLCEVWGWMQVYVECEAKCKFMWIVKLNVGLCEAECNYLSFVECQFMFDEVECKFDMFKSLI